MHGLFKAEYNTFHEMESFFMELPPVRNHRGTVLPI